MACVQIPAFPPVPDIFPLTLEPPPLPPIPSPEIDYCCRLQLIIPLPFIPIPSAVLTAPGVSAVIVVINETLDTLMTVIDALPLSCPLD